MRVPTWSCTASERTLSTPNWAGSPWPASPHPSCFPAAKCTCKALWSRSACSATAGCTSLLFRVSLPVAAAAPTLRRWAARSVPVRHEGSCRDRPSTWDSSAFGRYSFRYGTCSFLPSSLLSLLRSCLVHPSPTASSRLSSPCHSGCAASERHDDSECLPQLIVSFVSQALQLPLSSPVPLASIWTLLLQLQTLVCSQRRNGRVGLSRSLAESRCTEHPWLASPHLCR